MSVIYFCFFILFMRFSRQEYRIGLEFPSPVNLVLSELSTMTRPSWVVLHGMAHSSIELHKAVIHVIILVNFLCLWFSFWRLWDYRSEDLVASGQATSREGAQLHPSADKYIKDSLSMALPTRARPSFPHSQSLPSGSLHKPLILIHQMADRSKNFKPTDREEVSDLWQRRRWSVTWRGMTTSK